MARLVLLALVAGLFMAQLAAGVTRFEFHLAARDLPDEDICCSPPVFPSDGYAIVHYARSDVDDFVEFGRTRILSNNNDPSWPDVFSFNLPDDSTARFKVDVLDSDVDTDDFIGYAQFTMREVESSFEHVLTKNLIATKGNPRLIVTGRINGTRFLLPQAQAAQAEAHRPVISPKFRL